MKKRSQLSHRFVEFLPEEIEEGVLYVSLTYATASHRCCCGCGREVVTPLAPTDWKLIFDGENVSLYPSIGNWEFPCRSHYWIHDGRVQWAEAWSLRRVRAASARQDMEKDRHCDGCDAKPSPRDAGESGWLGALKRRWFPDE